MKVVTVVGTRPEIIRLSQIIPAIDNHFDHTLIHTGQNYDYELNQVFFDELGVRNPDIHLGVDATGVASVYAGVLQGVDQVLDEVEPDAVVILGDTNSAIAALMARRRAIPIVHLEAGNRCFDWAVPEEMNRRVVDHVSNLNLVYTEHARRNLLREGIEPASITKTGSPMNEVLAANRDAITASTVLDRLELEESKYYVASLHRQENVDEPETCRELFDGLRQLSERDQIPVVVSLHPRTRRRLDEFGLKVDESVRLLKPLGFHDYNRLQHGSRCVISDSGTISEEAALLGFAAVSPRSATERPEGIDAGVFVRCEPTASAVLSAVDIAQAARSTAAVPADYLIENTSAIVVSVLASLR